jgi:thiol-disulfide isomerase/thioredoxin
MNKKLLIENLEKHKNVILFFSSNRCGACQEVKPLIEQFIKQNTKFIYSNITEESEDSEQIEKFCKVEFYPTLIMLEGTKVIRYVGKNQIKTIL